LALGGCVAPVSRTIKCDTQLMFEKTGGDASFCAHFFKARKLTEEGRTCTRADISIVTNQVESVAWHGCEAATPKHPDML